MFNSQPPIFFRKDFKMCGYDPFYWYEKELDEQYLAYENGFESVEDYKNSLDDDKTNDDYDSKYN
jgi:hypothetical protein|nr:MAG TPA_asm: hypothetical protein [Caudoviricetes sp.]